MCCTRSAQCTRSCACDRPLSTQPAQAIFISITPCATRVAVLEGGRLEALYIASTQALSLVGNIYHGKILKVLPGIQAAFIEIGLGRAAFLQASDLGGPAPINSPPRRIEDVLVEGRPLLVQVMKDPLGEKGARLSTRISLSSRYLIYSPNDPHPHLRLSSRIKEPAECARLRSATASWESSATYILRTAVQGLAAETLQKDYCYLVQQWADIRQSFHRSQIGDCIYRALELPFQILREATAENITQIQVDCPKSHAALRAFAAQYEQPLAEKIHYYSELAPLFDQQAVENQIAQLLARTVLLPSGAQLVFDRTEAMTTVDVNTSAFTGGPQREATILQTNLEAAREVARQLRLRNIGGIIIIDFIDMSEAGQRQQVVEALRVALARDRVPTVVSKFSDFGLVALTRKRTQESLSRSLCEPCAHCQGQGLVKSAEAVCHEIFRAVLRHAAAAGVPLAYRVRAEQSVVSCFLEPLLGLHAALEEKSQQKVRIEVDTRFLREHFEIVPELS